MTIGERIKHYREGLGLTQTELATSIGVSKQTLYKYENNLVTNIPSDKIELLAKKLNVSPATIMGWEKTDNQSTELDSTKCCSDEGTKRRIDLLARHIDEFPKEQRERILSNFENTLSIYLDAMGIKNSEE